MRIATLGWGLYCASSWTWCIGMFLPVLMLQRYGWPGFLVFALPNVLGCAAFGYVLRRGDRLSALGCRPDALAESRQPTADHPLAMRLFSLATIAYHIFFLGFVSWLLLPLPAESAPWIAAAAPPALLSLAVLLSRLPLRAWPWFAALVYAGSLLVFARLGIEPLREIPWAAERPLGELAWLALPIAFGFALCPYLDLTFHRALQASPSRHAFGVFGVAFLVMIVLTCAYWDVLSTGVTWLIASHFAAQSVFTMSAHLRELRVAHAPSSGRRVGAEAIATLIALPLVFAGAFTLDALATSIDIYIRFLVFYGLLFPAYVLLFMGPGGRSRTRGALTLFAIVMLAFMPLYEMGFLRGLAWMPAIAVLALVTLAMWWRAQQGGAAKIEA